MFSTSPYSSTAVLICLDAFPTCHRSCCAAARAKVFQGRNLSTTAYQSEASAPFAASRSGVTATFAKLCWSERGRGQSTSWETSGSFGEEGVDEMFQVILCPRRPTNLALIFHWRLILTLNFKQEKILSRKKKKYKYRDTRAASRSWTKRRQRGGKGKKRRGERWRAHTHAWKWQGKTWKRVTQGDGVGRLMMQKEN